ncbi:MAG: acetoin utilization protein AcuC [Deltaproteobacteria bacterium]|nr:acetoin utilization protein AcuC [Deltaproteobacteria bacterium]
MIDTSPSREQARKTVLIHSPEIERYAYPDSSPFKTQRAVRTRSILLSMGLLNGPTATERPGEQASREELLALHSADYLDVLQKADAGHFELDFLSMGLGSEDCPVFSGMWDYSRLACGASLTGARLILSGDAQIAINFSGGFHHAMPDRASGFCYLNDVALACKLLADSGKRVCTIDLDVHHGDGVQAAFYSRSDVLTISMHESGKTLFPGTGFEDEVGSGPGEGFCANVPLPVGTYDGAYRLAFEEAVEPLARAYRPDMLVVELGMDGLAGDPLAHLNLTNNVFAFILQRLLSFRIPILATGGGGYHTEHTSRGWALCFSVLSGQEEPSSDPEAGLDGSEWHGGLRDRALLSHGGQRQRVDEELEATLERLRAGILSFHGL